LTGRNWTPKRATSFKPQPFVTRVIFIATPHRGSYMASNPIVKFGNRFLTLTGGLAKTVVALGKLIETSLRQLAKSWALF